MEAQSRKKYERLQHIRRLVSIPLPREQQSGLERAGLVAVRPLPPSKRPARPRVKRKQTCTQANS